MLFSVYIVHAKRLSQITSARSDVSPLVEVWNALKRFSYSNTKVKAGSVKVCG